MRGVLLLLALLPLLSIGCVGAHPYNSTRALYLQQVPFDDHGGTYDLAIVEFDDQGQFWNSAQLLDAISLIRQRNAQSNRGILVSVFIHGWTSNADPTRASGRLQAIRREMAQTAREFAATGAPKPDRLVCVYIGWRGDRISIPLLQQLTFWDRTSAAKRVASLDMQEALKSVITAAKQRPDSKIIIVGHSLGGAILERTIGPIVAGAVQGSIPTGPVAVDLVVLVNPAIEALYARNLIAVLRRHQVSLELQAADGTFQPAPGPVIASITSDSDMATKVLFPIGMELGTRSETYRDDAAKNEPSQAELARVTEGHCDFLLSHRAWVKNGQLQVQEVPNRYNNTPFWIIRVSKDVCAGHADLENPRLVELFRELVRLNMVQNTDVKTRLMWQPWPPPTTNPAQ